MRVISHMNWQHHSLQPPPLHPTHITPHCTSWPASHTTCHTTSCRYTAGEAVLAADALPPLALLHECVMREATSAKQRVSSSFSISPQALEASLAGLWPQLRSAMDADRKVCGWELRCAVLC
jgi:hypothetical protein